jgi:hypothetical protein
MATSRLSQILQQEYKTKGIVGGAVSALGKRTKEKIDVRNALFSGDGLGSTIGTKVFGKGYSATRKSSTSPSSSSPSLEGLSNATLEDINTNSKITAKNTMSMPMMARDMNLMKLNIFRMVKLLGGQANVNKTDIFFSNAKKREEEYERQFGKKPEQLKSDGTKKDDGGGFLSTILGFFKGGIGNIIETLIGALIKGGLVAGLLVGIGKYFSDPEFREKVNGMALKLFETIDSVLKTIFGEDYKQDLAVGAAVVAGVVVTLGAALIGLQAAIIAATAAIGRAVLGGGVPGAGLPDTPDSDKNKGKTDKKGRRIPQRYPKGTVIDGKNVGGQFKKAAPPSSGKFGGRAAGVLGGLMVLEAATGGGLSSIINYDDDRVWAISSDFEQTPFFNDVTDEEMGQFLEFLEKKELSKASNYYQGLGAKYGYTLQNKPGVMGYVTGKEWVKSPKPAAVPSSSSANSLSPANSSENAITPKNTPNRVSNTSIGSEMNLNPSQKKIADLIYNKFISAGFSEVQAQAAVANAYAESRLNPKAKNVNDKEASYGLFQMNTKGGMGSGHDPEKLMDENYNIDLMIKNAQQKAGDRFRNAKTLELATEYFARDLEKPANIETAVITRKTLAAALTGNKVDGTSSTMMASAGGDSARSQFAGAQADVRKIDNVLAAIDKPLFSSDDLAAFAAALRAPAMQNGGGGLTQVASVSKATPYERDFYEGVLRTVAL